VADDDDAPYLTLHALSVTAPVRHKVDIMLRLANNTTNATSWLCARAHAVEGAAPVGRQVRTACTRGGGGPTAAGATVRFELACLVLDSVGKGVAVPSMMVHPPMSTSDVPVRHARICGTLPPAYGQLLTRSAHRVPPFNHSRHTRNTYDRQTWHVACRHHHLPRRKETSLWFLDVAGAGVLADGRPAKAWALVDLAQGGVRACAHRDGADVLSSSDMARQHGCQQE